MSKVPSKHRRVACVVLACGVAMDTSVLSLGKRGPTSLPLKAPVPNLINLQC